MQRNAILKSPTISLPHRSISSATFTMSSTALPDITATPAADQHILHGGKEYTTIKEGLAYILIPAEASKVPQTTPKGENQPQSVFYNPIQQFNRDLSVLAIKAYGEDVVARKQTALEKDRERFSNKRDQKKRKREEGLGNAPRKAGKIGGSNTALDSAVGLATSPDATVQESGSNTALDTVVGLATSPDTTVQESGSNEPEKAAEVSEAEQQVQVTNGHESAEGKGHKGRSRRRKCTQTSSSLAHSNVHHLDALSATGLRALRYVNEIPFTTSVTANDLLTAATKRSSLMSNTTSSTTKSIPSQAMP